MYSDEENTTELIQNGIKHIGDGNIDEDTDDVDDFVDEVVTIVAIKLRGYSDRRRLGSTNNSHLTRNETSLQH